jgi:hypothetical protein
MVSQCFWADPSLSPPSTAFSRLPLRLTRLLEGFDDHNHQTGVLRLKSRMNQSGGSKKRRVFSGFFQHPLGTAIIASQYCGIGARF